MTQIILSPPVALIILLLVGMGLSHVLSSLAATGKDDERKLEAYACGQRNYVHNVSPDYSQFFPYAFFFTIMHVLVLIVATAPKEALTLPLLYVAAGVLALLIIFRR
jgi:NADH-quinone oxidoreductase subunit A